MNIKFYTLGCKVNQYESEALKEAFILDGFTCVQEQSGDIIVINSCTVTAESDRKTRQLLRRCRRENPNAVIVLTGCMAQAFPKKSAELFEADIVIGNRNPERILPLVKQFLTDKKRVTCFTPHLTGDPYNTPQISSFSERTRAFMKIEDGCDRFCSYCIIPYARGRVRSRSVSDIKAEAERLAAKGYKEIVLVGINLSAYGKGENFNICDAVDAVCAVKKIKRVRLGSLEPDHITDSMLSRLNAQEKFCPQFHLSLQSGCNNTLKRMNRHYDADFYLYLITRIRKIFKNASITTDVMVGFSGETNEEFNQSLEFVKKCGFARAHVFAYSRREGTVAAALSEQIQNAEKERRAHILGEAVKLSEKEFLKTQVGLSESVLFETPENGYSAGYTPNYTRILVKSDLPLTGEIHQVEIISAENDFCFGEIKGE